MRLTAIASGLALLLAAAPGAAAPRPSQPGYDPERLICKSRAVVGSRIQRERECHSAQQWEELKLMERNGLARQQINGAQGQSSSELYLPARMAAQQAPQ